MNWELDLDIQVLWKIFARRFELDWFHRSDRRKV